MSQVIPNNHIDKDEDSQKCRFGWGKFEETYIPYIFRSNLKVKYTAVRMIESPLKAFVTALPNEVATLHCFVKEDTTQAESQLLNEINFQHSDSMYGKDQFTTKDKIVSLEDAKEFYSFLKFCYDRQILRNFQTNENHRAGFIRIDGEGEIPFIVLEDQRKYVPLFYFEETAEHINYTKHEVKGWNLAYVKFCCRIQKIKREFFSTDSCDVISFDEVIRHYPPNKRFNEFWPQEHDTMAISNGTPNSINPVSSSQISLQNLLNQPGNKNIRDASQT